MDDMIERLRPYLVRGFLIFIYVKVVSVAPVQAPHSIDVFPSLLIALAVVYLDWWVTKSTTLAQTFKRFAGAYLLSLLLVSAISLNFDREYEEQLHRGDDVKNFVIFIFMWAVLLLPIWVSAFWRTRKNRRPSPSTETLKHVPRPGTAPRHERY